MKVLVTCGPTMVAVDDTRVITNLSTGAMGKLIAEEFKSIGAKVKVLAGPMFFDDFARQFKIECGKRYDVIVHAAAVSDFKVEKVFKGKVDSGKAISLKLVPTQKLIDCVKKLSPDSFLVGFKLESSLKEAIGSSKKLFTQSGCDLVVANTVLKGYQACIIDADGNILDKATDKSKIARSLVRLLK